MILYSHHFENNFVATEMWAMVITDNKLFLNGKGMHPIFT